MSVYITVKQAPMYRQLTLEEFLFPNRKREPIMISSNESNTRTYVADYVNPRLLNSVDVGKLISILKAFNTSTEFLRGTPREKLYSTFYIPKKTHGLRRIDAPNDELKGALYTLKAIFEDEFHALYHTTAFAYIKHRSTLDCVKRHQKNESKWFGKFDLSNFFGNTTMDFVINQLSMVFPFSEVIKDAEGKTELIKALELGFLNGGLPQGTPLSPLLTNIMMIPFDHKLSNALHKDGNFVYTRYADDFIISSKYSFKVTDIQAKIIETLESFNAPFSINTQKTRYGSSAGSNWNLGVMLNKDNNITIGSAKKARFKAMLSSYALDRINGNPWDLNDIQVLEGYRNYYRMIEREAIDNIVSHLSQKYGIDIVSAIKEDLTL